MGTYVFSGGNGTFGFNMLEWSAADLIAIVQTTFSSSHSSSQVTYTSVGYTLQARGSLGGYDANGDPTTGTVTSFTYTTPVFGAPSMSVAASNISLSVPTLFNWIFSSNVSALHGFLFNGNDTMTGSSGNDTLEGYGGGDTINGGAGHDTIFGENYPGDEHLTSAAGNDTLSGGEGDDNLFGQNGNDTLNGGNGLDWLVGGAGNDVMDGGGGEDSVFYLDITSDVNVSLALVGQQNTGGGGLDTLSNIENLTGSFFNDTLTGNASNNIIGGSDGNDVMNGGAGIDTVTYEDALSGVSVSLAASGQQDTGGGGLDTLSNFENFVGSEFNDSVVGTTANNVLSGGLGVDTVSYAASLAGVSVSLLLTTQQNTVGAGSDTLTGFENLTGSAFNDTLTGDSNANILVGGAGTDTINGDAGNDTIDADGGGDTLNGGDGVDLLRLVIASNVAASFTTSALTSGAPVTFSDGTAISGFESFDITAGSGNDTLTIDGVVSGPLSFSGGGGTDRLVADFTANNGPVTMSEAGVITFANGSLTAQVEEYWVTGGAWADTLRGGAGHDNINGGGGDDHIYSQWGDTVEGGGNSYAGDYLVISLVNATEGVTVDFTQASVTLGGGTISGMEYVDRIDGTAFDDYLRIGNLSGGYANFGEIYGYGGDDTLISDYYTRNLYGGDGNDIVDGRSSQYLDLVDGGAGDDTLYGRAGLGVIANGGAGNDTIEAGGETHGGDGNDTIHLIITYYTGAVTGDAGDDHIYVETDGWGGGRAVFGGAGNDTLFSSVGADTLNGDDGIDTADFSNATGSVTASLQGGSASGAGVGSDALSSIENLRGSTYDDTIAGNSVANTLSGGIGSDTLSGGDGADVLVGEAGNDTLQGEGSDDILRGGADDDAMDGGDGVDTADYSGAAAVEVDLRITGQQNTVGAGLDTVLNVENLIGTAFADRLIGSDAANSLSAGGGNDALTGEASDDVLAGGLGVDTAIYAGASTGASWRRNPDGSWTVTAGADGTDTVTSVEYLDFTDRDVFLDRAHSTFSGDGTSDIFMQNANGSMSLRFVNASGVTGNQALATALNGSWDLKGVGDFDGDSKDDVLIWHDSGFLAGWFMNGATIANAAGLGAVSKADWDIDGIGDINGDGKDDIIIWHDSGFVGAWLMNGTQASGIGLAALDKAEWDIEGLADFNGDGTDDILWRNSSGNMGLWFMDDGHAVGAGLGNVGHDWTIEGLGDFNGDGKDDILLRHDSGWVGMWFMDGANATAAGIGTVGHDFAVAGVGDYNGDGRDDILWWNDSGALGAWFMDGAIATGVSYGTVSHDWVINPS